MLRFWYFQRCNFLIRLIKCLIEMWLVLISTSVFFFLNFWQWVTNRIVYKLWTLWIVGTIVLSWNVYEEIKVIGKTFLLNSSIVNNLKIIKRLFIYLLGFNILHINIILLLFMSINSDICRFYAAISQCYPTSVRIRATYFRWCVFIQPIL